MRRWIAALTLLVAFATPATAAMTENEAALYAEAKKEGEINWYIGAVSTEVAEAMAAEFQRLYPGVKVNTTRATGQVLYQRLSADMRAGQQICDVFSSTDTSQYWSLKERGAFLQYTPENAAKLPAAARNFDPDGYFHTTLIDLAAMAYNTTKVTAAEAPTNWTDLADPRWRGKVALAHPGYSGTVGVWSVLMRKLYGEGFFKQMEANKPQIGRSLIDPSTMMASGERLMGIVSVNTASEVIRRGNPLALVYPTDGSMLQIAPSGIMKDSKRPNGAKLYLNYLMSVEVSAVVAKFGYMPMRPEVPPPSGLRPFAEVKVIRPTEAEVVKGVPEIKEIWRDVFGN